MGKKLGKEQRELFDYIKGLEMAIPAEQYPGFLTNLTEVIEIFSRPYLSVPKGLLPSVIDSGMAYLSFNSTYDVVALQDFLPGAKEMCGVPASLEATVIRINPDTDDGELRTIAENCFGFEKKGHAYAIRAVYPGHNNTAAAKLLYKMLDVLMPDFDESMFCEDREWLGDVWFKIGNKWFNTSHLQYVMKKRTNLV